MRHRFLHIVCALVVIASVGSAEEVDRPRAFEEFPEALGVFFGRVGGMGLSYHKWLPEAPGNGIQVAAGILYAPNGETAYSWGSYLDYSIGVEYQRSVYGEDFTNWLAGQLYLWGGVSHQGMIDQVETQPHLWDENTGETIQEAEYGPGPYRPTISIGVGIGVEVILFRHFCFPVEVGYGASYDLFAGTVLDGLTVELIPQGGARYRY